MSRRLRSHALSFSFSNSPLLSSSNAFVGDLETIGNLLPVVENGVGDGSLGEEGKGERKRETRFDQRSARFEDILEDRENPQCRERRKLRRGLREKVKNKAKVSSGSLSEARKSWTHPSSKQPCRAWSKPSTWHDRVPSRE